MTHDPFPDFPQAPEREEQRPKPIVTRGLLLAGVAAAGLMGVGLGLWARPAMNERRMATATTVQPVSLPRRQIQIVVDDTPAPIGEPIEVLPVWTAAPVAQIDRVAEPGSAAPVAVTRKAVVKHAPAPPRPEKVQVAKANPKARPAAKVELAKAAPAKAPGKLARLLVRLAPHKARADAEPRLEKVKFDGRAKASTHKAPRQKAASGKASHRPDADRKPVGVEKVVARKPKPVPRREAPAPPMRPSGLMKVANRSRCDQSDPGAALVCADPTLGAADRQLNRAYSDARAAGVSDAQLQRQQQRWLSARSAAARDAPWAVHDVYLARIAELNGLAREAGSGN